VNMRNAQGEADYQKECKQFGDHNSKLGRSQDFGQGVSNESSIRQHLICRFTSCRQNFKLAVKLNPSPSKRLLTSKS